MINLSTEDAKLDEDCVGLINVSPDQTDIRIKLNLHEVQQYSLFEGEIIVAEGFMGQNNKFNVNRIHKPEAREPAQNFTSQELMLYKSKSANRAIQVIIGSGPFTEHENLGYDSLRDLLDIVKRDRPQVLILVGPFLDQNN